MHLGRLFRTIFLIDYFTNTAFRQEMQHGLNRAEAEHILQRAIHSGSGINPRLARAWRRSVRRQALSFLEAYHPLPRRHPVSRLVHQRIRGIAQSANY